MAQERFRDANYPSSQAKLGDLQSVTVCRAIHGTCARRWPLLLKAMEDVEKGTSTRGS